MKKEEIESLEFEDEWLDADFNDHGSRRDNLGMADYEFVKTLKELHGGLNAIDRYLNATAYAWMCATDLVSVVDTLFHTTRFGTEDERYASLATKAVKEVFESMILALENAETYVSYDNDPLYKAEGYIRGFGYGLIGDINTIITGELGRVTKVKTTDEKLFLGENIS